MDTAMPAIVLAAVAIDTAVVLAALLAPWPGTGDASATRIGVVRLALAASVALGALAAKVAAAVWLADLNGFGFLHLLYAETVVVVPASGAVLLWAHRRGRVGRRSFSAATPVLALAGLAVLLAPLGAWATLVEPRRLQLETIPVDVSHERSGHDPLRIGVLADIQTNHVSAYDAGAVARLNAEAPDVTLIAGDLFQGTDAAFDRELADLGRLLAGVEAPHGVFAIPGNVDRGDRLERATAGSHVVPLRNDVVRVRVGDRRLTIIGLDNTWAVAESTSLVRSAAADPDTTDVRLVLAHRPDAVLDLPRGSRIDLVVAGHTHGGQVRLPLIGPILTLSAVPKSVAAGGLHLVSGNRIYVSRGVGSERGQAPLVRLNCPPEITVLELAEAPSVRGKNGRTEP